MRVVALVPAAGLGVRLGSGIPKALVPISGLPMIAHSLVGLRASEVVHRVVVAAPADARSMMDDAIRVAAVDATVVDGGHDRTESVRLAMQAEDADIYLVHDAARAFTPPELIRDVVRAVIDGAPAVVPVLPVADTVREVNSDGDVVATPDRTRLRVVQTPQGFHAELLRRAYGAIGAGGSSTDDAGLVERLGELVHTVPGDPRALKITTPFDLAVAEAVLAPAAKRGRR